MKSRHFKNALATFAALLLLLGAALPALAQAPPSGDSPATASAATSDTASAATSGATSDTSYDASFDTAYAASSDTPSDISSESASVLASDGPDVTLARNGNSWTLSNGLVTMLFNASTGAITRVTVGDSADNLLSGSYAFSIDSHISNLTFSSAEVVKETPDEAHIAITYAYDLSSLAQNRRFKEERHLVMVRGVSGIYDYVVMSAPKQKGGVSEARTLYGTNSSLLNKGYNGEQTYAYQSTSGWSGTGYGGSGDMLASRRAGTTLETAGPRDYYSKYDWAGYYVESPVVGNYGNGYGAWMIYASHEYISGGPLKQELILEPSILENYMTGGHMGGDNLNPPAGWSKIFGPWLVYFNSAGSDEEVIADANSQMLAEKAKWPYDFVTDLESIPGLYPKKDERSTVSGRVAASDGRSLGGAMVILTEPGLDDVLRQANGYYFWTYADEQGNFTIPNVRAEDYALFVYPQHGSITGQLKLGGVSVGAGEAVELGTVVWEAPQGNNYLFQIGKSDHRSVGFGGSTESRSYYWLVNAPASLAYNVNTSSAADWYYTQPYPSSTTAAVNATVPKGVWEIKFDSTKAYSGEAALHLGLAGVTNQPKYNIYVNGTLIKTLDYLGINDQGVYRQAMRSGRYFKEDIAFDAGLLAVGENTITFENVSLEPSSQFLFHQGTIMYDTIFLTTDEAGNTDSLKQLVNSGVGAGDITAEAASALKGYLDARAGSFDAAALSGFNAMMLEQGVGSDFRELLAASAGSLAVGAPVNKAGLAELAQKAGALKESDYKAEGWGAFAAALEGAMSAVGDAGASQGQVYAAKDALLAAMDGLARSGPEIDGYSSVYYTDFEDGSLWGFERLTTGMFFPQVTKTDIGGRTDYKFECYSNGPNQRPAHRKTLAAPVGGDRVMATFDLWPGGNFNVAAQNVEVKFLDGNGDTLIGIVKNANRNLGAYAQLNRPATNFTGVQFADVDGEFMDNNAWYSVAAALDKEAGTITATLTNAVSGAAETLVFEYDSAKNDGAIAGIEIGMAASGQTTTYYLDNLGIYEGLGAAPADKSALEAAIGRAQAVDLADYTSQSATALTEALVRALAALADEGASQEAVDEAATALEAAFDALTAKTDVPADAESLAALASIAGNAEKIAIGMYSEATAGKLGAAKTAAAAALDDSALSQAGAEAALAGLAGAIGNLELAPEYAYLSELSALLLRVAALDGNDFTPDSWTALNAVATEAWGYIGGLAAGTNVSEVAEIAALEAGAEGAGAALEPLAADIPAAVAQYIVRLHELLAALQPAGSEPPDGKMIAGAVHAEQAAVTYLTETGGGAVAEFRLEGANFSGVGSANLRLSFKEGLFDSYEIVLADSIKDDAGIQIDPAADLEPVGPFLDGYETHSVYIFANAGKTLAAADGEPIAYVRLKLGADAAPGELLATLVMSHLDIVYYDAAYKGGAEGIDAEASIDASVAVSAIKIRSRFDVNDDGVVSLADVDAVRRYLGAAAVGGAWASEAAGRCDLNADGYVQIDDLTAIMAKYELTVA
jgi:rhamnogalacturonan endolyase